MCNDVDNKHFLFVPRDRLGHLRVMEDSLQFLRSVERVSSDLNQASTHLVRERPDLSPFGADVDA